MSGNAAVTVTATCNKDRDHLQFAGWHELSAERNCILNLYYSTTSHPSPWDKRVLCRRCTVWFNIWNSPRGSTHPINPSIFSLQFSYFTLQGLTNLQRKCSAISHPASCCMTSLRPYTRIILVTEIPYMEIYLRRRKGECPLTQIDREKQQDS